MEQNLGFPTDLIVAEPQVWKRLGDHIFFGFFQGKKRIEVGNM